MADMGGHLTLIEAELAALRERPLSVRHALLVAALLDRTADIAFAARAEISGLPAAEDILGARAAIAAASPALGRIADLCGMAPDAPRLRLAAVPVPAAATDGLTTAEFMVGLYGGFAVPLVVLGDEPALPLLEAGLAWWRAHLGVRTGGA